MKKCRLLFLTTASILTFATLTGCSGNTSSPSADSFSETDFSQADGSQVDISREEVSMSASAPASEKGAWDSTPDCLVPAADGVKKTDNDVAVIDYSHSDQGYICVNYTGSVPTVKVIVKGPDEVQYKYLFRSGAYNVFPLAAGNGNYEVSVCENVAGTKYSICLYTTIDVNVTNEFGPFLYPNQFVNFNKDSNTVTKCSELAEGADTDLDVVTNVYNYMVSSITYDYDKASDPPTDYVTDVDAILNSGTGICLDYAAVMAAMLRSQQIPTRLEVGYAKDAYHAWISVYTQESGWLNDIIQFDGKKWTLVDPTFGANSSKKSLKKFIGDGSNYTVTKVY
ncbi:MAG: transglutaminase-like domain-containing protein [bacterium]|nr:transglutaminase-like domain-containing protein [bacterium]